MSDEKKLHRKIAQVISAVEEVEKKGHNAHFNYDYATAEDVLRVIRKPLAELNVTVLPSLDRIEERTYMTRGGVESTISTVYIGYTFTDGDTGETITCPWAGQGDDPVDKGWGKAATNSAKTFLRQAFLLPQGDDPEADTSTDQRSSERTGSRRQPGGAPKPSEKQLEFLKSLIQQKKPTIPQVIVMLGQIGATGIDPHEEGWSKKLTGGKEGQCSALIEVLKNGSLPTVESTPTPESDVPNEDVPAHEPQDPGSDIPWEAEAA